MCYSENSNPSSHICDDCKKYIQCYGAGGACGLTDIEQQYNLCYGCYYEMRIKTRVNKCYKCEDLFKSRNKLFKHLYLKSHFV